MCEKLPTGNYRWRKIMTVDEVMKFNADGEKGLYLRVRLRYPKELHDKHNDYPMAVEKKLVSDEMLSPFARSLGKATHRTKDTVQKLIPNLNDKEDYVVHIKNLQYYIKAGLVLEEVKQVLEFTQYAWLKPYIEANTRMRAKATSDFEKDLWKLASNSVFGKTCEDVCNRIVVDLVTEEKQALKLNGDPRFKHMMRFHDNLVAVHRNPTKITLDRPMAIGVAILELSKLTMLRFHYDIMMPRYGPERCRLLFTDTDSLCYHVTTGDIYRDMYEMRTEFDTSNYPKDHPLYSAERTKQVKFMKDEFGGIPMEEFAALAPKMYGCKAPGDDESEAKCTAKGVKRSVSAAYTVDDYKGVLDAAIRVVGGDDTAKPYTTAEMYAIRSAAHEMYLVQQKKIALSAYDNKKALLKSGLDYMAYGHYRMPEVMAGHL